MQVQNSTQASSLNRVLGISLAAFSMFVLGYTASRVFLAQSGNPTVITESAVTPHQASLWSTLAE